MPVQKKKASRIRSAEKIVEGRLEKFKDEVVLLRQPYIRDENITVEKLLLQTVASTGENLVIRRFQRWELGESAESSMRSKGRPTGWPFS